MQTPVVNFLTSSSALPARPSSSPPPARAKHLQLSKTSAPNPCPIIRLSRTRLDTSHESRKRIYWKSSGFSAHSTHVAERVHCSGAGRTCRDIGRRITGCAGDGAQVCPSQNPASSRAGASARWASPRRKQRGRPCNRQPSRRPSHQFSPSQSCPSTCFACGRDSPVAGDSGSHAPARVARA